MMKKPESLVGIGERFATLVEHSGESDKEWAAHLGTTPIVIASMMRPSRKIIPPAHRLLEIDDLCGRSFLSPPERQYAEWLAARPAHPSRLGMRAA